ncbi:hypothetical protein SAY86_019970 [Trapa natans]|uniref:Uncharacterized protein n=1 Tax=Trapa natans TaxID=22666 RepID=A0AAN7LLU4_TRANT|nr:hypothetical protein SAY86_019970 [Trapa natans]
MTIVEDKETKIRSMVPPSDFATAIPFKKRWQIIRPPSPLPEEACPIQEPSSPIPKEPSPILEPSLPLPEEPCPIQEPSLHIPKEPSPILEPSLPLPKEPSPIPEPSLPIPREPSPILEPNQKKQESSTVCQGSSIVSITAVDVKPEMQLYEDVSVSLDKFEHHSVQLALANGENNSEYSSGTLESENVVTDLCTSRSNWDLNTTMDAWEGSAGDALSISRVQLHGQVTVSGDRVDKKPLGSSYKRPDVNISGEHIATEHHWKEINATTFAPSINPPTHGDSLKLGLGIQLPSSFGQEPPILFPGMDSYTVFSRVSSVGSSSVIPPLTVKLEPYEDAQGQACLSNRSGDPRSLVGKVVKREIVDKCGSEVSSSTLKLFESRLVSVKAEPTCEAVPIKLRINEEVLNSSEQVSPGVPVNSSRKVHETLPVNSSKVSEYQTISSCLKGDSSGREDNEYEDGEVKDQLVADGPLNVTPLGNGSKDEDDTENMESTMNLSYQCVDSPHQEKEDSDMQLCSDMEETHIDRKSQMSVDLDDHLEELSDVEVDYDSKEPATTIACRTIFHSTDENPVIHSDIARISSEATINNHELTRAAQDGDATNDDSQKNISILPMTESSRNSNAVGRDSYTEGNRSRVINLSATFNMSCPGKTGYSSDRSMPLHDGRKSFPNIALERDKPQLRGRDEVSNYDLHRFSRERNWGMFSQNSRSGFLRDRERVPNNVCDGWESDQDFGSEIHKEPLEFRATQYRYNPGYRNYNVSPDNRFVGTRRGGHRFLMEENSRNFNGQNSMRRAHEGREGPVTRSPPIVGRVLQNMNPSRRTGMDDSELVGVRYGFSQRERNIGSFSGKGYHHINSKSPVRLRSRSPVQRSPDGFVRHSEMAPRRSPPMYRRERMGSPDRAYFRGEVLRRHNSPPYTSRRLNDMREMNSGRDTGFTRPIMHNRDSSTRVSFRTRRYDMSNSRERTTGDQYYRFPMRGAARFHDLSGTENADEGRLLNEKRGSDRQLRPSYGSENKGFTYNSNGGSRSYRLCAQGDDSVYHEGGNSRERQSESCPTNEPEDAHKTRKIEDQEGSFSHGVSDEFDDMPIYKREHF